MKQSKKRKRGQLKPRQRKSSSLNLRVLDELREKLEVASRRSGRTLSEEAAFRLTMSFHDETQAVRRGLGDVMVEMLDKLGWRSGIGRSQASGQCFACLGSVFIPKRRAIKLRRGP